MAQPLGSGEIVANTPAIIDKRPVRNDRAQPVVVLNSNQLVEGGNVTETTSEALLRRIVEQNDTIIEILLQIAN